MQPPGLLSRAEPQPTTKRRLHVWGPANEEKGNHDSVHPNLSALVTHLSLELKNPFIRINPGPGRAICLHTNCRLAGKMVHMQRWETRIPPGIAGVCAEW